MPKELADRWRASERPVSCEQIWQPSLGYMNTSHSWKVSQFKKAHTWCSALVLDATLSHLYVIPEPLGGVRNLRVTDPTTSTLTVQWEPAEGSVRQYRIFYVPAAGGVEDMVSKTLTTTFSHLQWNKPDMMCCISAQAQVSGSTYSTVLKNLDSDTVYTVSVVPVYAAGEGLRMSENGKTCKHACNRCCW